MHSGYVRPEISGVIMATSRNEHNEHNVRHRLAETKAAVKTTEFFVYLAAVLGTIITAAVVDNGEGDTGDLFDANQAMQYITWLTIGYMIARGLAKSGSRHDSDS
jgi:Mn2+/Fe2+ NRAMP family transporter